MNYIDYPIAQTLAEVIEHFNGGGEVWQELEEESPECAEYDNLEDITDLLEGQGEYIGDFKLHLVK